MKAFHVLAIVIFSLLLSGCLGTKTTAFLLGTGVGVGVTCMYLWGNPFCNDGSQFSRSSVNPSPLWQIHDPYFPDASVPYDMY